MNRFIIGSGRCGSTLLTNMLAKHPDLMMISEFLGGMDRDEMTSKRKVSGMDFTKFMSSTYIPVDITVRRGMGDKEILTDTSNLKAIPVLLLATLPTLTDQPEALFQELLEATNKFPEQTIAKHIEQMFSWMMRRLGKTYWIERSGASIEYFSELIEMFPDAKYVHLHRDGPESALSMYNFNYFRVVVPFFFNPPDKQEILATEYGGQPVTDTDPFSRRMAGEGITPEKFAEYWSYQQTLGARALARLKPEQFLEIRFEHMVSNPVDTLVDIADFFELPYHDSWINIAANLVTGVPPSRRDTVSPEDYQAVIKACEVGQLLLGRKESPWIKPTLKLINEVARENNIID